MKEAQQGNGHELAALHSRVAHMRTQIDTMKVICSGALAVALIAVGIGGWALVASRRAPALPAIPTFAGAFIGEKGDRITLMPNAIIATVNGRNAWSVDSLGPSVTLYDESGNERGVFGVANIETKRTGDQTRTAPGSITLFAKDGTVIWQAP